MVVGTLWGRVAGAALVGVLALGGPAWATTVTVSSTDSPWNYASGPLAEVAGSGSTTPAITAITPGAEQVLTFSTVTGVVSLTPGYPYGPDGGISSPPGAYPLSVAGAAGLSGIVSTHAAFLAGVFLNGKEGAAGHVAPATLSFGTGGAGDPGFDFGSLAPADDQVFFIGDGLTAGGATQRFAVPSDATGLVLALADANGYSGPPGAYFDNGGSFTATFALSQVVAPPTGTVPEPASAAVLASALAVAMVGGAWRTRRDPLAIAQPVV